jgi:hypothetical protein
MAKKILIVLSGYGYWGEELVGPKEALEADGLLENGLRRYGW